MYVRLAFAVAVHVDPDVLLVDEVLSVGDEPFQRKCMDRIREFQTEGRTIVLVSHSSGQVGELCDRTIVLDSGLVVFDGGAEDGLRILREGYEETRHEESAKEPPSESKPDAEIIAVEVLDRAGHPVREIASGEPIDFDVTFSSRTRLLEWRASLSIETALGQVVYGTNTYLNQTTLPPLDGQCRVRFSVPHIALVTGQYYVTTTIETITGTALDVKYRAALFSVRSDGTGVGVVDLRPQIVAGVSAPATS